MSRWQRLWRRNQMEEQLEKELRFHLDQHTADLMARGHSPEEARRLARLALGASGGDVVRMILRQSLGMISLGVVVGTGAAWAAGRVLERLVEGIGPTGASTFLMTIPIPVAAALFASFLPARRASRVDPVKALRAGVKINPQRNAASGR